MFILGGMDGTVDAMKRYSMLTSYAELVNIPEKFQKCFGVDLNAEWIRKYQNIEDRWNAIIEATNMHQTNVDFNMIGKCTFEDCLQAYKLFEWDIWLNAYFSIKYMENKETAGTRKIQGVSSDVHELREFKLPFDSEVISEFCSAYKLYFFTKERKSIFDVKKIFVADEEIKEIKELKDLKKMKFRHNLYLEAWSYKRIERAEFEDSFDTEDRILFYKTIDCNLARKLTLYHYYQNTLNLSCEEKDFVHMCIEKMVCQIDSFAWKNLYVDTQIKALRMSSGIVDMSEEEYEKFVKEWIEKQIYLLEFGKTIWLNAEKINERLVILTQGLIYCILNFSMSQNEVCGIVENVAKEKAERAMEELMEIRSREYELFPRDEVKELRLKSAEHDILKYYAWTQAKIIAYNPKFGWDDSNIVIIDKKTKKNPQKK